MITPCYCHVYETGSAQPLDFHLREDTASSPHLDHPRFATCSVTSLHNGLPILTMRGDSEVKAYAHVLQMTFLTEKDSPLGNNAVPCWLHYISVLASPHVLGWLTLIHNTIERRVFRHVASPSDELRFQTSVVGPFTYYAFECLCAVFDTSN